MTEQIIPRERPDYFNADLDMAEELSPAIDESPDYTDQEDSIFWDNMIFPI